MKAVALVSGGKDSVYAAHLAESQGFELVELLTLAPEDPESMMFHTPNLPMVRLQAEAWGIPHRRVELPERGEAAEEARLEAALRAARAPWIVVGAIASTYQYYRLLGLARRLERRVFAPLWGRPGLRVVRAEVAAGLDIRFVHLAAEGIPSGWLGRRLDAEILHSLESGAGSTARFHPAGEGGEFETLVVDAPFFRARLVLDGTEAIHRAGTSSLRIRSAHLEPKAGAAS